MGFSRLFDGLSSDFWARGSEDFSKTFGVWAWRLFLPGRGDPNFDTEYDRVDPRFPAGLPFPASEILEFVAFREVTRKIFQQFSRDFPEFSSLLWTGYIGTAPKRTWGSFVTRDPFSYFVNNFFVFAWEFCIEKWRVFLVNFFWSPSPTKRSTKSPRKIRGKFGAKFGAKSGTKIPKIREAFVRALRARWPKALLGALFGALFGGAHWHSCKQLLTRTIPKSCLCLLVFCSMI